MKPKFMNKTVMDSKTCQDFLALVWRGNGGAMRVLLFIVGGFAIAYSIFQVIYFREARSVISAVSTTTVGLIAVFLGQWGYLFRVKKYVQTQQKAWGENTLEKVVRFYDKGMVQSTKLGEHEFGYEALDKLLFGKNNSVIQMKNGDAVLISNNGFIGSNLEEFKLFLKQKMAEK